MGEVGIILEKHCNDEGLPILDKQEWASLNNSFSRDEIKDGVVKCLLDHHAPYPFRIITHKKMSQEFLLLCQETPERFIINGNDVLEKFDDYRFPFNTHGLFTIQLGHRYNDVSNFFMQEERHRCAGYNIDSPLTIWQDADQLKKLCSALWRMNNDELSMSTYRGLFRLGAYVATQFKPHVARTIYHITLAKNILDMSCGWGDRLAAFYASPNAEMYVGCDPNEQVFEIYKKMCVEFEQLLTGQSPVLTSAENYFECRGKKVVRIYCLPSEDLPLNYLDSNFDCIFSSPPYFSTERYNEGGVKEGEQSWKRYSTYTAWRDEYLFPSLRSFSSKLTPNGVMLINIIDPVIKNIRYRVCDEMVGFMTQEKFHFIGQIGMRIKQRPKKSKELLTFMKKHYIENVWCFSKNKFFTFKFTTSNNLERFFP